MPFLKDEDRAKYDDDIDSLVATLKTLDIIRRKPELTYVVYKLLFDTFDDCEEINRMFHIYGCVEATRFNIDKFYQHYESIIESKRWLNGNAER